LPILYVEFEEHLFWIQLKEVALFEVQFY